MAGRVFCPLETGPLWRFKTIPSHSLHGYAIRHPSPSDAKFELYNDKGVLVADLGDKIHDADVLRSGARGGLCTTLAELIRCRFHPLRVYCLYLYFVLQ